MQLYMSWYIRSFLGFTFLNILYVFKYSCTNIFHRRSLYTFYYQYWSPHKKMRWPGGSLICIIVIYYREDGRKIETGSCPFSITVVCLITTLQDFLYPHTSFHGRRDNPRISSKLAVLEVIPVKLGEESLRKRKNDEKYIATKTNNTIKPLI